MWELDAPAASNFQVAKQKGSYQQLTFRHCTGILKDHVQLAKQILVGFVYQRLLAPRVATGCCRVCQQMGGAGAGEVQVM